MENDFRKPEQEQYTIQRPKIPSIFPRWMGESGRAASIIAAGIVLAAVILAVVLASYLGQLR